MVGGMIMNEKEAIKNVTAFFYMVAPVPTAMVHSNLPELCVAKRMPNLQIDYSKQQLSFA